MIDWFALLECLQVFTCKLCDPAAGKAQVFVAGMKSEPCASPLPLFWCWWLLFPPPNKRRQFPSGWCSFFFPCNNKWAHCWNPVGRWNKIDQESWSPSKTFLHWTERGTKWVLQTAILGNQSGALGYLVIDKPTAWTLVWGYWIAAKDLSEAPLTLIRRAIKYMN